MTLQEYIKILENDIKNSYEQGISQTDAEKLAGTFLVAQIRLAEELKTAGLDSRMKKSGIKAVRASAYLDIVQKSDKKPTEAQIAAMIDTDGLVNSEQESFDRAEINLDYLERYYDIFKEAHIHFRSIAKGSFST